MSSPLIPISFHFQTPRFYFPDRIGAKLGLIKIFKDHKLSVNHINYIFCTDRQVRVINKGYLNHDYNTDILTFDLSSEARITADIFISVQRAASNAKSYKVSRLSEIHRLLIHGALHLCGYDDKTKADKEKMSSTEDLYLNKLFVSRETI